jgi:hypothetical protein
MANFKWLASFVLAANMVPALLAETHAREMLKVYLFVS